jgi:hypothetical protein
VAAAERYCELVAYFATECPVLDKTHVMWIGRREAADQARLFGDEPDVLAVANPARLGMGELAFVDAIGNRISSRLQRLSLTRRRRLERRNRRRCQSLWFPVLARGIVQVRQPGPERIFHSTCICGAQGILGGKIAASPNVGALDRVDLAELVQ